MTQSNLTVVATVPSVADASLVKGILDEAGIPAIIRSDNAGGMYPAIAGAEVLVRTEDVDRANDALQPLDPES